MGTERFKATGTSGWTSKTYLIFTMLSSRSRTLSVCRKKNVTLALCTVRTVRGCHTLRRIDQGNSAVHYRGLRRATTIINDSVSSRTSAVHCSRRASTASLHDDRMGCSRLRSSIEIIRIIWRSTRRWQHQRQRRHPFAIPSLPEFRRQHNGTVNIGGTTVYMLKHISSENPGYA